MADNVDITEGDGTKTIATDDIQVDGAHTQGQVQFVKLVDGTLNGTGSVRVNQAAKANALTVAPATDITDGTYIGDINFGEAEPNSAAIKTAVELLDNAVDGNYLNTNMNLAGTDAQAGEGVITASTQRVTIATDDDGVAHLATIAGDTTSLDGKITACNTGAVTIGAAIPAGDNNIGNVDIVTVPAPLSTTGGGTEATAQRVTIANDSTGTLTVDTTGTAGLEVIQDTAADLNCTEASAADIKAAVELLDNAVDGNYLNVNLNMAGSDAQAGEGTISATTQRVTIATDDDGVAHLATIANRNNGVNAVTDWTAVAQNAVGESGTLDCSTHEGTAIYIQAFLDTTTAHTGTRFIVQTSSNTTGNEDWHDYREFVALVGTAATDLIEDNPLSAGSTSLTLTGHALTTEAIWIGIEDGTLVNSELIFVASQSANAVVALDGTTNEHAQNTAVFNVAISKVVILDGTVNRARVIVDNTYDDNGSTLNYKVRATDLER